MTVPGVNLIATATFLAAVGDITRFSNSRRAGRLPRIGSEVRQSGEQPARSARITKRGSASARWALVEAAWSVVTSPGRCAPTTSGSRPAAGTARRSSPPRASSRSCSGACLPRQDYAHQQPSLTAQKLRRLELAAGAPRPQRQALRRVGHPPEDAPRRETTRRPGAGFLRADRPRLASRTKEEGSGRERDSGARIVTTPGS